MRSCVGVYTISLHISLVCFSIKTSLQNTKVLSSILPCTSRMGKQSRQFLSNRVSRSQSSRAVPAATSTARARVSFARPRPRRRGTNERAAPSTSHARPIQMSATMASANLRATGVAPRVASRDASARVATMFRSAGPNAEKKLGDAMVAAAGKFGAKHQMEVRAALSEDAPSGVRREFLKKALLGVRLPLDRARARSPRVRAKKPRHRRPLSIPLRSAT